jgi:hypothetical protein
MDTASIERPERLEKWRESAQGFKKRLALRSVLEWNSKEFTMIVEECSRAGLLSWSAGESPWSDLKSATAAVEELSLIDASLGLVATNQYLCRQAVARVSDLRIRGQMEQHLSARGFHDEPRWLSPNDDKEALTFFTANAEPAFVGIALLREWRSHRPALVINRNRIRLEEWVQAAVMGFDVLYFRRIDLKKLFQSEEESENLLSWQCTAEEFRRVQRELNAERAILFSVILTATAQRSYQYAMEYSRERRTFGRAICQHQAVMLRLADMAIANESAQLMIADAVSSDPDIKPVAAQRTWSYCREAGIKTALQASQLLGGHGYLKLYPLEKWLRDVQSLRMIHKAGYDQCLSSN